MSPDIKKDIESILGFDYETEGQFTNIISSYGYKFEKTDKCYRLFKAGGDAEIKMDLQSEGGPSERRGIADGLVSTIARLY